MKFNNLAVLGTTLFILLNGVSPAFALEDELLKHPLPEVAQFYSQNQEKIDSMRAAIKDPASTNRQKVFLALIDEFPEAAEIAARELVQDSDAQLALSAIGFLKQNLVMTGHGQQLDHSNMQGVPPRLQYLLQKHELSRSALRKAILDSRVEIRNAAVSFLASQSDEETFAGIQTGVSRGLYSDTEAANYFSLGNGSLGQRYLEPYIGKGDAGAQKTAIEYLGFYPKYQDMIKTEYFVNPSAPADLRAEAASTLSKNDPRYPEYALVVASPTTDPLVYEASVSGYVNAMSEKGTLDPQSAKILNAKISEFLTAGPAGTSVKTKNDLLNLQERLKALSGPLQ